jgi:hypothetical protein
MACDRFADALKRSALGVPLRSDAAAHLAVCSACQALVEREEHLHSIVTTALARVRDVTPPPELVPALRRFLLQPPPRYLRRRLVPAAAIAFVLSAVAIVPFVRTAVERMQPPGPSAVTASGAGRVDVTLPPSLAPRIGAEPTDRRPVPRHRSRGVESLAAVGAPEVIVPADQRRAVGRLFDALREGRPEVVSMLRTMPPQGGDVVVPPIRIDPLTVSSLGPVIDK